MRGGGGGGADGSDRFHQGDAPRPMKGEKHEREKFKGAKFYTDLGCFVSEQLVQLLNAHASFSGRGRGNKKL